MCDGHKLKDTSRHLLSLSHTQTIYPIIMLSYAIIDAAYISYLDPLLSARRSLSPENTFHNVHGSGPEMLVHAARLRAAVGSFSLHLDSYIVCGGRLAV